MAQAATTALVMVAAAMLTAAAAAFPCPFGDGGFRGLCSPIRLDHSHRDGHESNPLASASRSAEASSEVSSASLIAASDVALPSRCGERPLFASGASGRIVGGREASPGEYPWQVQLWNAKSGRWRFQCGGTLVSDSLVVTAAHCFKHLNLTAYEVRVGRHNVDNRRECAEQRLRARKVIIHPDFKPNELSSDLALIFVASEYDQGVLFTDSVQPACLPTVEDEEDASIYAVGLSGDVSGWGLTDEHDRTSAATKLQYVTVREHTLLINNLQCWS
jgi:hypothetical protein